MPKHGGNQGGRPTLYTRALADEVLRRIANGEGACHVCHERGMPGWRTVYDWTRRYPAFAAGYARAQATAAHFLAAEALELADNTPADDMIAVKRNRLRVEQRRWRAARLLPQVYG
jgi:hypothetical protein